MNKNYIYKDESKRTEAFDRIQTILNNLNKKFKVKKFDSNKIQKIDFSIENLNGKTVKRVILFLRSNGCLWKMESGGCSECGLWAETTQMKERITEEQYLNQIKNALDSYNLTKYPVLCLYNAGSILQEEEIQ